MKELENGIMEKLWLVYEYGEGSAESKVEDALNLFNEVERQTTVVRWIEVMKGSLDWEDNIFDLVERILKLPKSPPQYRDKKWIPLEDKLQSSDYKVYYDDYQGRLKEAKARQNY